MPYDGTSHKKSERRKGVNLNSPKARRVTDTVVRALRTERSLRRGMEAEGHNVDKMFQESKSWNSEMKKIDASYTKANKAAKKTATKAAAKAAGKAVARVAGPYATAVAVGAELGYAAGKVVKRVVNDRKDKTTLDALKKKAKKVGK